MKMIFMGTPDFAVPCLEVCHKLGEVSMVVTQPDRPKGRGKKLAAPPVKEKAIELGIPVIQPERIKKSDIIDLIRQEAPDVMIVVAYGQLLSQELLDIPRLGCINVHASLLPKLRGASPINSAIVTGEKVTGVMTQFMTLGLDEGDMIDALTIDISDTTTAGELHDSLMALGGSVLEKTLQGLMNGTLERAPQDHSQMTYAPILTKEMGHIDWQNSAQAISCLIRGFDPWPTAYSQYEGQVMKLYAPIVKEETSNEVPGTIIAVEKQGLVIATGKGQLVVQEVLMPNSRRMKVSDYVLGHEIKIGTVLK